jgi:hypothetical protein
LNDVVGSGPAARLCDYRSTSRDSYEKSAEMAENDKPDVRLVGTDGNAFAIIGKVARALRQAGKPELVKPYMDEAMSGDYDHLLQVPMRQGAGVAPSNARSGALFPRNS